LLYLNGEKPKNFLPNTSRKNAEGVENAGIVKRCKLLSQYSAFIGKVREYEEGGLQRKEAVRKAAAV